MMNKGYFFCAVLFACSQGPDQSGASYFEAGEYQKAVDQYTEELKANTDNATALYNRGRAYEELGKGAMAAKDFEKIVKLDPQNINAYLSLAKLSYNQHEYSKVLIYANAALKVNENSSKAHFLAARGAHQLGYFDQALESYNSAININDSFGEAYLYRGALKIGLSKAGSACKDFLTAKRLDVKGAQKAISEYCK